MRGGAAHRTGEEASAITIYTGHLLCIMHKRTTGFFVSKKPNMHEMRPFIASY